MKRKKFISKLFYTTSGLFIAPTLLSGCSKDDGPGTSPDDDKAPSIQSTGKVRFGVITDVHQDFMPDAEERLEKFINVAKDSNLDFIIQIGDFCYPKVINNHFMDIWNSYEQDKFHVLGNHDMDVSTKETFLSYVGQRDKGAFYSFDKGGFHFVVLDNNFIKKNGNYIPYANKNYTKYSNQEITQVSSEQLEWLRDDLKNTDKPVLVFSHAPIYNNISNRAEVLKVLNAENNKGKKIIGAFSGHQHLNWHVEEDGINHVQINSSSYKYSGRSHPKVDGRYSEAVEKAYPLLPQFDPYDDSLFAFVEIDGNERTMSIKGKDANFVPPSPYDLGYYEDTGQFSASSNIDSRRIVF